jgi:hypothetical protein
MDGSLVSVVGLVTGYGLDDRGVGFRVRVGLRIFSYPRCWDRLSGPPSHLKNTPLRHFPGGGVKRPGREAGHSPPTSTEVKKMCLYTSTPPYSFIV